ncbi:unnamed protein product [Prunus armeniaca]|uniref:Uncharacterized protein n=1 Tax=Prunus armeniaca TaxID=36596 RepID=A0A6J5U5I8_PRUAR|nr:unnamed protein product [Prunus armeniaca]
MNPDWQYQLRDEIREVVGDNQIDSNIYMLAGLQQLRLGLLVYHGLSYDPNVSIGPSRDEIRMPNKRENTRQVVSLPS